MRLAVAMLVAGAAMGSQARALLDLAVPGPGLPEGWQTRPVRGFALPDIVVLRHDSGLVLRTEGAGRAGWIHRDIRPDERTAGDSLAWSWRVLTMPGSSDFRDKERDDAPIRFYVIFGNPRSIFGGNGRVIFYSFGNREPEGYRSRSHVNSRIHIVRVDGAEFVGSWREHAVDPAADYRKIWNSPAPPITGVGFMQDTDQTGEHAVAEIRALDWRGGVETTTESDRTW